MKKSHLRGIPIFRRASLYSFTGKFLLNRNNYSSHNQKCQKEPPEVFYKRSVLKNFAKFTGKYLCQSLFFNKVAGLRPATLLKKRLWHRCFPVNFAKFLGTPFLQNTSGQMLLTDVRQYGSVTGTFRYSKIVFILSIIMFIDFYQCFLDNLILMFQEYE